MMSSRYLRTAVAALQNEMNYSEKLRFGIAAGRYSIHQK